MSAFLVDEDLPRSLASAVRTAGLDAVDVRDVGLRGRPGSEVFAFAQLELRVLLSGDLGFANILHFPLGSHHGIVVARLPNEMPVAEVNAILVRALRELGDRDLRGSLVIVESDRVRLRTGR